MGNPHEHLRHSNPWHLCGSPHSILAGGFIFILCEEKPCFSLFLHLWPLAVPCKRMSSWSIYCSVLHHHSTTHHSTAKHSTAQHSTAQHSTAQHSTAESPRTTPQGKFVPIGVRQRTHADRYTYLRYFGTASRAPHSTKTSHKAAKHDPPDERVTAQVNNMEFVRPMICGSF